jgi:hypothetical protein
MFSILKLFLHKQIETCCQHINFNIRREKNEKNQTSLGKKQTYLKCEGFCHSHVIINKFPLQRNSNLYYNAWRVVSTIEGENNMMNNNGNT